MSGGFMALGRDAVEAESFDLVFDAHHDYVYNLAHALLRNAQDAEDVTLPSFKPERAAMRTWLAQFVVNACKTHRRRNFLGNLLSRNHEDTDPDPADASLWGAPEDHALRSEVRRTVKDVLGRLRLEHRTVLVLHYYLEMSCPEIASVLGCPEGTVYSRLHYARRVVQVQLERVAGG
jgi:RNA polymerase sigma factor (sigma-70 family)